MEPHHVHRLMFYSLEPHSIVHIAYNRNLELLAVLRNNNTVELWNMKSTPFVQSTVFLEKQTKLRELVWFKKRLFGADLTGSIKELNLFTLKEESSYVLVTGGTCNCIAVNQTETLLAAGTELGYINIFKVKKRGLSLDKLIQSETKRILCISWDTNSEHIVTGGVEFLRLYKYNEGRIVHMMKPAVLKFQKTRTICIWCITVTNDFTIFTGDSSGSLSIWDGKQGVCVASFKTHIADVLTLCLSRDQNHVYCAGIDPDIRMYAKISVAKRQTKWVKAKDIVTHTHDVNALVELNNGQLCSGGVDSYLMITKTSPHVVQIYPPLLQSPSVSVSTKSRFIMLRYPKYLEIWHLQPLTSRMLGIIPNCRPFVKLVELQSKDDELIRCADISDSGEWIAYATNKSFRIFTFSLVDNDKPKLELVPVDEFPIDQSIRHICFTSNNEYLCVADSLTFQMIRLHLAPSRSSVQLLESPSDLDEEENWEKRYSITRIAVSQDGKYIALASKSGQVSVWAGASVVCSLPRYDLPATAIAFQPESDSIFVTYSDYMLIEFSVKTKHYTSFSKSFDSNLLTEYLGRFNLPITNISFDSDNSSKIVIHTSSDICVIDKNEVVSTEHKRKKRKISLDPDVQPVKPIVKKSFQHSVNLRSYFENNFPKTSNEDLAVHKGFHVFEKYQHLVHFGSIGSREMIAVEIKPKMFLEKLPAALKKDRFGRK